MSSRQIIVVGGGAAGVFAAITCAEAANQHIWAAIGLATFGIVTLVLGTLRNRRLAKKAKEGK